ncbi:MAG TPA: GTPase ObgE [Firmicutes bacterium]|nr:GTPase ObgE [Bacillota bacterium]
MFVDEVIVKLFAGPGGDGCTSFRREKCEPMGGPDGGNGGKGASIYFVGDRSLKTLVDLRYHKIIKGEKGINGKGSNKYGHNREDIKIAVPLGTTVTDCDTGLIIADIVHDKEEFCIAKGGRGGRGNKAFATHSDPAPGFSEKGEPGEERIVKCELKMIADVGLIGLPSVGKSTLLSQISGCHPKIAAYHFTTLSPNIGVVKLNNGKTFTMADLPGLIEGASEGIGLGHKFLKHASRTKILAHVVDMGSAEGRDPLEDYDIIDKEVAKYDERLHQKFKIVIANKMDLDGAKENLKLFKKAHPDLKIFEISAATREGLDELLIGLSELLETLPESETYKEEEFESHILYKFKEELPFSISKEGDMWSVNGEKIEKLLKMTRIENDEAAHRFARKLRGMGVDEELERLGAKRGDEVKIMDYIFIFKE